MRIVTLKKLKEKVIAAKPDGIIMLFEISIISFVQLARYCIKKSIPYGIWSCGYVRPQLNGIDVRIREKLLHYFDSRATVHIAYGSQRRDYLMAKNINSSCIAVAQNTIDVEPIMKSYEIQKINQNRYGSTLNILFVGALIKNKRLDLALRVADSLVEEGYSVSFTVIGGGTELDSLRAFRETLQNKNNINIVGPKYGEELREYWLKSDVFLLTGSGGLAINEAMAYGLPVISTPGDGTGVDLIDGNGQLLSPWAEFNEVKNAIINFYTLSKEEKLAKSERSLELLGSRANVSLMVENYHKACLMLLERGRGKTGHF